MSKKRARHSTEFKLDAVRRMADCQSITALAKELGVRRKFLYLWRDRIKAGGRAALEKKPGPVPGSGSKNAFPEAPDAAELRIAELERLLGRKQLELDFFKRAFEQVRGAAANRISDGGRESIASSKPHSHSKE
jgi:transposase-like protein